ncbi:hypothetical protein IWX64_001673 [Arthrobacter sp. CAN_A212]|uniref:hypothetical protein n=1 Tax=unclassified Arthrobacter TaxID=235627 RepID=UPI0018CB6858|nr:hypothetical protein [Arthrobacter sp. CAN_C5]MBP2217281.1 hypothetical protein [Arthrobacter sp. CAN_C5]
MINGNDSANERKRRDLRETNVDVDRPVAGLGPVREGGRRDRRRRSGESSIGAQEQVALLEAGEDEPFAVDPEILKQQKALADRAAALNTRALSAQQPSIEQTQHALVGLSSEPGPNDPTAAHNLSIFSSGSFIALPVAAFRPPGATTPDPLSMTTTEPVNAAPEQADPIGARTAHGLEPLDAMTAGLARVKRLQLLQYSIVSLGALALITGVIMITGVFS